MSTWEEYARLWQLLRTHGVEALVTRIEKNGFGPYEKEALRAIARLPVPYEATADSILRVAEECSRGHLEFAFQVARIGELAREIIRTTAEGAVEPERVPEVVSDASSFVQEGVPSLLISQHMLLLGIRSALDSLSTKSDIDLKGQCPFCHGPLVEVVVANSVGGFELRLRCRDQEKPECHANDWFIQDLAQRSP